MRFPDRSVHAALLALLALAAHTACTEAPVRPAPKPWDDVARPPAGSATWGEVGPGRAGLSVGPDGSVWITAAPHEIYRADSVRGDWQPRPAARPPAEEILLVFDRVERVTFFDARRAIATGYLEGSEGTQNRVYRTDDGGRTWAAVTHPGDAWIYHAAATPEGEAWLGGSTGQLLHSADFGCTWRVLSSPFDESLRLHTFHLAGDGSGIAGALANQLAVTSDGGRTWRGIATPLDQGAFAYDEDSDARIETAVAHGADWVVEQDGRVFRSRRDRIRWTRVDGVATIVLDEATGRLFGMDADGYLLRIDGGVPRRIASRPLHTRRSGPLTAAGGAVYARDETGGVYRADGRRETFAYPASSSLRTTHVDAVGWDGAALLGVAGGHLHRSPDMGRSWRRVAWLPLYARDLAARGDGTVLVWDGHGRAVWVDARTGRASPADALAGWDVVGVVRTGERWLAYGGMQHETARRVEVAQTFAGGEFDGTRPAGFVLSSSDEGRTWTTLDEWKEGGVAALFPHADGAISLYSYLGSVRRLEPAGSGRYRATNLIVADGGNLDAVPYVQWVSAFHFDAAGRGVVEGEIHHVGLRRFTTADGGRTWTRTVDRPGMAEAWDVERGALPVGAGRTVMARTGTVDVIWPDGGVTEGVAIDRLPPGEPGQPGFTVRPRTPSTVVLLDGTGERTLATLAQGRRATDVIPAGRAHLLVAVDDGSYLLMPLAGGPR